ncbi:translation initiation factor eIF-2B subunit alpha [Physcia stellaris]|nr:translation initiation factor eIF-2B subunit alpha [Physcia stellaris]
MAEIRVVVIGAGVAGLTTALLLSRKPEYSISVTAKHMPETAVYTRTKDANTATADWLCELVKPDPWYKDIVPDFQNLTKDDVPPGHENGNEFTSVCINTAIYLPWLTSECLRNGVKFQRRIFKHISDAANAHHSKEKADIIINCTGLSARKLGGVMDENVIPVRGQTVLVRNEADIMAANSGTDDGDDESCYIMQRAAGGGTLLGGSYQKGNWDSQIDLTLANRIMKRAVDLCPSLTGGKGIEHLSIIRHSVGLRPLRIGGTRLEKEKIGGTWIIHNYGHGGYGYQSSYGCSQAATKLVEEVVLAKPKL